MKKLLFLCTVDWKLLTINTSRSTPNYKSCKIS